MEIVRVLAPNPGPYTGPGTNTYVIHDGERAAILDPGPVIASHRHAIGAALGDLAPIAVIVTHNHPDHAPLANPLSAQLDVPSFGYGPGPDFTPDVLIGDGDHVPLGAGQLTAVHTPGHTADHLCFLAGDQLFTGDHIMGGSTVIIEDASAYFASLERVASLDASRIHPGHGNTIDDAAAAIADYIAHRRAREDQIVAAVAGGADTVAAITAVVYDDIDPALIRAASSQVVVQLEKLVAEERLSWAGRDPEKRRVVVPDGGG